MDDLLILTFIGGLAAAVVLGYLAHKVHLSPIVGYLLAGLIVGPYTPGFEVNHRIAESFSKIGVILLLFGVGLRLHIKELLAVWKTAVPGALIQCSLSTVLLAAILRLMGYGWSSGLLLGLSISVASTVVMTLVLGNHHDLHSPIGHIAIGWTVVEDLLTVVLLLVLPILLGEGDTSIAKSLGIAGLKIVGLCVITLILGRWVIPWLLERIDKTRLRELFTLSVLVLALGLAGLASSVFGVSIELGAFLAGLAVGSSEFAARAAGDAVPMRDAFSVLFFVSTGMLFDPSSLLQAPWIIVAVLLVIVIGKPAIATLAVRLLGKPLSTAAPVGVAFAQIGEFSFILGALGKQYGLVDSNGYNALVATSILSIALNPIIYSFVRKHSVGYKYKDRPLTMSPQDSHACVLLGYGPVGQIVYKLLTDQGSHVTVIDLNLNTVRSLRAQGIAALYGDVLRPGTLEDAGLTTAACLILSAEVEDAEELIKQARRLNPWIRVLVRCNFLRAAAGLKKAGANVVAAGEAEVGVALAEAVMASLKQSPEENFKQRMSVRQKLYEDAGAKQEWSLPE